MEEQGIVGLRVLHQPAHRIQRILTRRSRSRVWVVIRKNDDVARPESFVLLVPPSASHFVP